MAIVPWSPLAYGLLTGKYDRATVEAAPSRAGGLPTTHRINEEPQRCQVSVFNECDRRAILKVPIG